MKKNLGSAERRHWSSKIWIDQTRAWTLGKGHHKHNKFGSECKLVVQDPLEIDPSGDQENSLGQQYQFQNILKIIIIKLKSRWRVVVVH